MAVAVETLLIGDDPAPVLRTADGGSPWLLVCDHAGNAVPTVLHGLGVAAADLSDHIGIDIGIWPVTQRVAADLGAIAIGQAYSRLVIDCNRRPGSAASIPVVSDGRRVPGNAHADIEVRVAEIFAPYHAAIAAELPRRRFLAAMHSFTRVLDGKRRTTDIGVIYGPRSTLADAVIDGLAGCGLRVDRNAPYQIDFADDYTLPVHAQVTGLDYVEIEVCQDLIGTSDGQAGLAKILTRAFMAAQESLS